jgi:hypothetical protein
MNLRQVTRVFFKEVFKMISREKEPEQPGTDKHLSEGVRLLWLARNLQFVTQSAVVPADYQSDLAVQMVGCAEKLPIYELPNDLSQVYVNEMRRRLRIGGSVLSVFREEDLSPQAVLESRLIPVEDVAEIEPYLARTKPEIEEMNKRVLKGILSGPVSGRDTVPGGDSLIRREAEAEFGRVWGGMRARLRKGYASEPGMLESLEKYDVRLNWYTAVPPNFHMGSRTVQLPFKHVLFVEDGKVKVLGPAFLSILGHELAHVLHRVFGDQASGRIPSILRIETDSATLSAEESVANDTGEYFFGLFTRDSEILGLFGDRPDPGVLEKYMLYKMRQRYYGQLQRFGVLLAAQGVDLDKIMEQMQPYSLEEGDVRRLLEELPRTVNRDTFLQYMVHATRTAERILARYDPEYWPWIRQLMLEGYWTPPGLEDWVRVNMKMVEVEPITGNETS